MTTQPTNPASATGPPGPVQQPWQQWLSRRPLLLCTVCFLLGIVAADQRLLGAAPAAAVCLMAALAAILTSRIRAGLSSASLLLAFAMLGAFLHSARLVVPESDISHLADSGTLTVEGVVASRPVSDGARLRFDLRAERAGPEAVTGLVRAAVPQARLHQGDRVRLEGAHLSKPRGGRKPGEFDYARWLGRRGVTALLSAEKLFILTTDRDAEAPPGLMDRAVAAIERAMPGPDADMYAHLLVGMVYGLEAQPVPSATVEEFRRAGTVHLLVVSGAQVTMLVVAVLWLVGVRWRSAAWWHLLPVGLALLVLVLIVGMGESVARAVAMFALLAVAALTARDYDIATAIAFAALVICLVDTNALFSLGFQLTFAATIGVVVFLPPEPLRMINRSPAPRSVQALRYALWGTVGAWVMVTPLLASAFGGFPLLGNIANLVNVPLSGLIMVLGFLALPLALLSAVSGLFLWTLPLKALCALARLALDVVMGVNWLAGSLPLAYLDGVGLSVVGCLLWYALVAMLVLGGPVARARQRLDRPLTLMHPAWVPVAGAVVVAAIWLGHGLAELPPRHLEVSFLPVGAGQCAMVRAPAGATMMVDCGGRLGVADEVVRPWLSRRRVRELDLLTVSHWDADHYNGLPGVLGRLGCGAFLLPPELPDARPPLELQALLDTNGPAVQSGGLIRLGGGVTAEVLAPRLPWLHGTADDANNNSVVLRLSYGRRAILLTGDLQQAGIERLERDAAVGGRELRADVVCLPHHGRGIETSLRLLELSRPSWAVASCDRRAGQYLGEWGEALLAERGIRLLRTDQAGTVTFITNGDWLRVRTSPVR